MDGPQLLAYAQRRLAEYGLDMGADRTAELYEYLTEGRDQLKMALAGTAPVAVKEKLALEQDPADDRVWTFPAAAGDPLRVLRVYDTGNPDDDLSPSSQLNGDEGDYEWENTRTLRLADHVDVDGVKLELVLHDGEIDATTASAAVGLPTPCHRAIGKWAAVLALTADEESDASVATGLLQKDLDTLATLYGDFDANAGLALRHALMRAIGTAHGDTLA